MAHGEALTVDLITRLIADSNLELRQEVQRLKLQLGNNNSRATEYEVETIDDSVQCQESLDVIKS